MSKGKFICPDCRKDIGKSLTRDATPCSKCGKRICNYCHVAQKEICRHCKTYAKPQKEMPTMDKTVAKKKKKFLIF